MCRAQHLGRYLEGQGHSMTFKQNSFRPITFWFEVEVYNYFTGMVTILRQLVACNIWVATLKAKVTAWPCTKIVSGPELCYFKSDFTTTFDKLLLCVQYLFGEHYPVPTGSCFPLFCLGCNSCVKEETHIIHILWQTLVNYVLYHTLSVNHTRQIYTWSYYLNFRCTYFMWPGLMAQPMSSTEDIVASLTFRYIL